MKDFNMLTLGQLLYDLNDSYTHFDVYEQTDDHIPFRRQILSNASQDEIVEFSKNHLLDEVLLAYNDLAHSQGNRISIVLKKPNS
jgi:predicted GTPase